MTERLRRSGRRAIAVPRADRCVVYMYLSLLLGEYSEVNNYPA